MKRLALFDFDGTLTYKDSFLEFIRYYHGKKAFYLGMFRLSPWLLAYKAKLLPNWRAKEKVLEYFFGRLPEKEFRRRGEAFARELIPAMLRPKAEQALRQHLAAGDRVLVVSASAEPWLRAWCNELGVELLATGLECENGLITGKIKGKNCYGPEKVRRIREYLKLEDYQEVYVYGDSSGDREMLTLASHPHYRYF